MAYTTAGHHAHPLDHIAAEDDDRPQCESRGCPWRGPCPEHDYSEQADSEFAHMIRQRPMNGGRKFHRQAAHYQLTRYQKAEVSVRAISDARPAESLPLPKPRVNAPKAPPAAQSAPAVPAAQAPVSEDVPPVEQVAQPVPAPSPRPVPKPPPRRPVARTPDVRVAPERPVSPSPETQPSAAQPDSTHQVVDERRRRRARRPVGAGAAEAGNVRKTAFRRVTGRRPS